MLGSQLESLVAFTSLIVFVLLFLFSLRSGALSPVTVFLGFMIVGVHIRRYYLLSGEIEEGSFWAEIEPFVAGQMTLTMVDLTFCVLVAIIVFFLLSRIFNPISMGHLKPFVVNPTSINFGVVFVVWLVCAFLYLGLLSIYGGGITNAFLMLQKRAVVFGSEIFAIRLFNVVMAVSSSLLLFKMSALKSPWMSGRSFVTLMVCLSTVTLLFLAGGRGATLSQVMILYFVWIAGRGSRINYGHFAALGMVVFLVIVSGFAFRISAVTDADLVDSFTASLGASLGLIVHAFAVLDLFASARYFAEETGFDYGMQFVHYFTRFVPRDLFPSKPMILGMQIRDFYSGHTLSGAPPTFFGEFYIAFGHLGMVIGGVVLGWVFYYLNSVYLAYKANTQFVLVYFVFINEGIFNTFRAGLETSVFQLIYALTALAMLNFLSTNLMWRNSLASA